MTSGISMAYNEEGKIREYKPGWMAAELEEAVFETTQRHGAMVAHPADRVRGDVGSKPT